jgi:cutinase
MRIRLYLAALSLIGGAGVATVTAPSASAAACSDIDVVSARGTFEPGNLGLIVGDPVYSSLQRKLTGRSLTSYKVNYPADLSLTSAAQGNADLVNHVNSQASSCPNQRFILVGYSQGANVVDNSIGISSAGAVVGSPIVATIPAALESRVAAVLLFGNPIRAIGKSVTGTYQSRTIDFLGYTANADAAATFAAGKV